VLGQVAAVPSDGMHRREKVQVDVNFRLGHDEKC
jgi:hypothetical protein